MDENFVLKASDFHFPTDKSLKLIKREIIDCITNQEKNEEEEALMCSEQIIIGNEISDENPQAVDTCQEQLHV